MQYYEKESDLKFHSISDICAFCFFILFSLSMFLTQHFGHCSMYISTDSQDWVLLEIRDEAIGLSTVLIKEFVSLLIPAVRVLVSGNTVEFKNSPSEKAVLKTKR